jgi:hypothetical protein
LSVCSGEIERLLGRTLVGGFCIESNDSSCADEKAPHLPKDGRYGPREMWATCQYDFPEPGMTGSLVVGDFNRDGKPDVAVVNPASNSISVFLNTSQ